MSQVQWKPPSLEGNASIRHADIARDLRTAIASEVFPVGTLLPTELELSARFGVSRHTVRIAIATLAEEGLLTRRKRLGTVVLAAQPTRRYRQTVTSVEDLAQYGADHLRSVRKTKLVTATKPLARDLNCPVGTPWFCISSLRYDRGIGDVPLGTTDVYVKPEHSDMAEFARRSPDRLISSFFAERTGQRIARINQDVTAVILDKRVSDLLKAEAGAPALRVVRHYLDDQGELFVASISVHPADRFHISSTLDRVGGALDR